MGTENISYLSIVSLMVLLMPVMLINRKLDLHINKKTLYAIGRMFIQLTLVGIFLQYIFELNSPMINLGYLGVMMTVASLSAVRSCKFRNRKIWLPVLLAFFIPNIFVLLFFNTFVIQLDNVFHAQYLIPIAGMLLGNSLTGNIIGLNSFYNGIRDNKNEYFYALSLSGNKIEALKPYFKGAILSSVNPTLASIETIGLVALPGMMTGQILGGALPLTAIKYQIAIMIAILIARYFSTILSLLLTSFVAFDDYDILILE